jgi:hypothetical protein
MNRRETDAFFLSGPPQGGLGQGSRGANLLELLESHALVAADAPYARLGVLAADAALEFHKQEAARLLDADGSTAVPILKGGALQALAIARPKHGASRVLGRRIGELGWLSLDAELAGSERRPVIHDLLDECELRWKERFDLITALVDIDRSRDLEALHAHGARVHGVNSTWVARLERIPEEVVGHRMADRATFWEGPPEPVLDCVRSSYARYRSHYHADSRLRSAPSSETYVSAVADHLQHGGRVVVACREGHVEGFSTVDPHDDVNRFARQDLAGEVAISGVSPEAKTPGVYEITLRRCLRWFKEQGFQFIIFGCKADNFTVQSVWTRLGEFAPRRSRYRLHWWLAS